jgi:hypothetical protein
MASKKPSTTAFASTEEILTQFNDETRMALTETPESFTGGVLVEQNIAQAEAEEAQAVAPEKDFSFSEAVTAIRKSTATDKLTVNALKAYDDPEFVDFDPELDRIGNAKMLLRELGLPDNEENLAIVGQGGTAEDQAILAQRLTDHQFNQEVLAQHGGWAITANIVDPVYLIADLASFGGTRAFRMGRIGSGVVGAGTVTGVNVLAEQAGQEVTNFDYVLGAALTGGIMSLMGGDAANRIANGTGNWYGRVRTPAQAGQSDTGAVTRFFSAADTAFPTPEAKAMGRDLIDDPLIREEFTNNSNAASIMRRSNNETEGLLAEYDTFVEEHLRQTGFRNWVYRKIDLNGQYTAAKAEFNSQVAGELLRRNDEFLSNGYFTPSGNQALDDAADTYQRIMDRSGEIARDGGLPGFENFTPQPGYFHRVWNGAKIRQIGTKPARELLYQSIRNGIRGIDTADARAIARAITDRAIAKESGLSIDLNGVLGNLDTKALKELLEQGGMSGADLDAAVLRLESKLSERGGVKYARSRLPLDMSVSMRVNGQVVRMQDLIDTDLDRIARNYTATMNGRSALAKAGVGRDDYEIGQWKQKYLATVENLPREQIQAASTQLDTLLSDFTGNIPDVNRLGPNMQRLTSLTNATMLSAQGVWQAAEYATIAHRFGLFQTTKEMFKRMPGVRPLLRAMNQDADLADEVRAVLNLDLARDVRYKPWMQQHDAFLDASDTWADRLLHAGKQAMPFLTGMKYIHQHQTRMAMNLALQKVGKAMQGKEDALAMLREYGPGVDWEPLLARNSANVTRIGNTVESMNWATWAQADVDQIMNATLRMVDDSVLHGRVGQGTSFGRTQLGQVLGQFRSFVGFAHNKLLRGTLNRNGPLAMASLLAFQYPLTVLMVTANEARKGTLELETDEDIKKLMGKAVGYTAGMGFFADAANSIGLTGGRSGLSVPVMGLTQAPGRMISGTRKQFDDDPYNDREGVADIAKGATMVTPIVNGIPGTALFLEALKGD